MKYLPPIEFIWSCLNIQRLRAITFLPFIVYTNEFVLLNPRIRTHQRIHLQQQYELFAVGLIPYLILGIVFNIWLWTIPLLFLYIPLYVFFYLLARITYGHKMAYMMNPFEREACRYESITNYPLSRRWFTWLKLIV